MGNNGSRTGNITQRQSLEPEQQWAHSFPRNPPRIYQPKVLPDRDAVKKLRPTNNGEILHSGGTISGRHQQTLSLEREDKVFKIFRVNSTASNPSDDFRNEEKSPNRTFIPYVKGVHRYAAQRYENRSNMHKEQMKKFGSEPDLRDPIALLNHHDIDRFRGKKKYKAPPPPKSSRPENAIINCYRWGEDAGVMNEPMVRRGRLFKTKAELKKKYSSPVKNSNQSLDRESTLDCRIKIEKQTFEMKDVSEKIHFNNPDVEFRNYNGKAEARYNRLSLPEMYQSNSVPEFQAELKEVIQRIKSTKPEPTESNSSKHKNCNNNINYNRYEKNSKTEKIAKDKLKTLDHNISKRDNFKSRSKQPNLQTVNEKESLFDSFENDRGQPSGKESTPEKIPQILETDKKEQPSKLFYFGMNEPIQENILNDNAVEHFAATLQSYTHTFPVPNSTSSDISSELEMDESQVSTSGIALQLRPILPKKQLEIPRFSPAAAWKLLSAVESNFGASSVASDDVPIFIEERIEKLSRPPPPPAVQVGPRSSYDKSGDSGISGDAGPAGFEDCPEGIIETRNNIQLPLVMNRTQGNSWTPQQDLGEEESSTDEEMQNHHNQIQRTMAPVKFTPKPNVFSLSLPRDNQLSAYIANKSIAQSYVGLQRLKRSVSGVLGNLSNKRESLQSNSFNDQSENWFLSKSAPNSLNNGFNSLEIQDSHKSEEKEHSTNLVRGRSNTQNVTRIMYLPELDNLYVKKLHSQRRHGKVKDKDGFRERSRSAERTKENYKLALMSKSCENISAQVHSSPEPEDLQDPPKQQNDRLKVHKPKRFTFQSTIRQIERRRLAEKLSREAEKKEKLRLSELEAMQKVEEEFQRKRAREKATIRQQLRLYSLDETAWSSLPPNLDVKDDVPPRSEPDGAVSSSASSPSLPSDTIKQITQEVAKRKITPSSDSSEDNIRKTQMTQILSEYRQPQREYKDFRGSPRYRGDYGGGEYIKQTTVHPQVTYNMPKASGHQGESEGSSNNYRRQFAHGVKTSRSGESTYSDDSQQNNRNYSPKIYRSKNAPVSRF